MYLPVMLGRASRHFLLKDLWTSSSRPCFLLQLVKCVCERVVKLSVFITAVPSIKLFAWGEGDSGGHVLRETTSRGLCGLVCPSHTSEHWGEGDHVKEGGGGEGDRERERALGLLL